MAVWIVAGAGIGSAESSQIDRHFEDRHAEPASRLADLARRALGLRTEPVVAVLEIVVFPDGGVEVVVPVAGETWTLDLWPHSVRSELYEVLAQRRDGSHESVTPGPVRSLRGVARGVPGSSVAGSLLKEGLLARISLPDGGEYWVEPLAPHVARASAADHIVYSREAAWGRGGRCAMTEALGLRARVEADSIAVGGIACGSDLCVAQIAFDADVEYFEAYGSVAAVESRINAVINLVNFQYERDVAITHFITTIIVRTAEPDPYDSSNHITLLGEFRDEWIANNGNVTRDLAQLLTGKELDGGFVGVAWGTGQVCETSSAFSLTQSDFNGLISCTTDVTAHEMGHLWNAGHCACTEYTMNPSINCANQFHATFTVPDIMAHRDSRTCLTGSADVQSPIPNPMTFESSPTAASSMEITMTASIAMDATSPPVTYRFDLFSGGAGGNDSDWQTSPVYVDTGLQPATAYGYRVRARDGASPPNVTAFSAVLSATTNPAPVCGDGVIEEDEECDPPDGVDCDAECRIIPPDCVVNGDCNDGSICTDDGCVSGHCQHANNTLSCASDACFPDAVCRNGTCQEGQPLECDDGDICTDDSCDPAVGCQHQANDEPCDDGDICTTDDACAGGACVGDPVGACDDGDPCTANDTCFDGACTGTEPTDCDDGNSCTSDLCDSESGCVHEAVAGECDDGDACTTDDFCEAGVCVGGGVVDCDDGDICTDDSCDAQSGCQSVENAAACDDGDICTTGDTCDASVCSGTPNRYGDADHNGKVDLFDIFCVLDAFEGRFGACAKGDVDIADCQPNGVVDLQDILAILDAFEGVDACCGG